MKVSKFMNPRVLTCRITDSLARAARLMWDHDIGCVPVVDDRGRVEGILTDRDIAMAAYLGGETLAAIPVSTAMAAGVWSCAPGDGLDDVEDVMSRNRIRRLPVIDDDGVLVGIITLGDLARASRGMGTITSSEVVSTLIAVSAPRDELRSIPLLRPERAPGSQAPWSSGGVSGPEETRP